MSDDPAITFYRLQACPFCERVARVLDELDLPYHSRFVEARHSRRDVVKRLTGSRTVPAIVDESTGVTMSESANIVRYLEQTYGDGAGDPERVTASAGARTDGGVDAGDDPDGGADTVDTPDGGADAGDGTDPASVSPDDDAGTSGGGRQ